MLQQVSVPSCIVASSGGERRGERVEERRETRDTRDSLKRATSTSTCPSPVLRCNMTVMQHRTTGRRRTFPCQPPIRAADCHSSAPGLIVPRNGLLESPWREEKFLSHLAIVTADASASVRCACFSRRYCCGRVLEQTAVFAETLGTRQERCVSHNESQQPGN